MTAPFRIAVVGGGRMGQMHIRALAASDAVKVVAVVEPFASTAGKLRDMGLTVYSTIAEMVSADVADGAIVTTPTDQHLSVVEQLSSAGLPVLCEKPAGLNPEQAQQSAETAKANGTLLQVAYWRRFIPALQDLRRRIASGEVGNVHVLICTQWDEAPPAVAFRSHSGGIFIDMGVHEIDEVRWLTGQEIVGVTAHPYPSTEDEEAINDVDSAQALLTLSGGTSAVVSLGRFHPGGDLVAVELFASREHVRIAVLEPPDSEGPQLAALARQAEAFARCAQGGPAECASIEDAVAALVAAQMLSDSAGLVVLGEVS